MIQSSPSLNTAAAASQHHSLIIRRYGRHGNRSESDRRCILPKISPPRVGGSFAHVHRQTVLVDVARYLGCWVSRGSRWGYSPSPLNGRRFFSIKYPARNTRRIAHFSAIFLHEIMGQISRSSRAMYTKCERAKREIKQSQVKQNFDRLNNRWGVLTSFRKIGCDRFFELYHSRSRKSFGGIGAFALTFEVIYVGTRIPGGRYVIFTET